MSAPGPQRLPISAFHALQNHDFRYVWAGLAISATGTWMQIVAQSLLVLDLTHGSALALGTVSAAQAISFLLLAPVGGGVADRVSKRKLLLSTQAIMMGLAVLLGALTAIGAIRFWMIPLAAFANGAALSFDQPARSALVAGLVPPENLMNAIALQSAVFNGAALLGPALAGLVLSRVGYAGSFFVNAASYSAVVGALLLIDDSEGSGAGRPAGKLLDSVRAALLYVRRDTVLPAVVAVYGALLFFGPSTALMLPLFARQILHVSPSGLGLLFSAAGGGTVVSALIVASLGDFRHKGRLLLGSATVWVAALALFGLSNSLAVAVLALAILGAAQNGVAAASITLLQTRVPPEMRGRAMSLNTLLIMFVRPLGDFPAAAIIGGLGLRPAVLAAAAIVASVVFTLLIARPQVRNA
jgi:MFS family permease